MRQLGKLDKPIQLVKKTFDVTKTGRGTFGEIEESSTNVNTTTSNLFAKVEEYSGTERNENGKETSTSRAKFTIRHTEVDVKDTIIYNSKNYDILHIKPNPNSRDDSLTIDTQTKG
tara:strand:- start:14551 stop:14898 length:348 start_codon:yes stop_codon:yes gene_type:complete